ncbi:hypothetical protein KIH39_10025 [Telmatocola sphagniphila]|uniref:DNA primase n=1 Tax=Telmatocola sphagniphila TaxID=1123043 RepID=A0A8E6BC83_9BACT|nr:hypothetical protein [Telmatocola sphagniphila]QVL34220.1 hypothetical protein KIH39_10025 [Telmatocola sphagniphila]
MIHPDYKFGFRVAGDITGRRNLIDFEKAFLAYLENSPKAETHKESYLSAFVFGADFRAYLDREGSPRGFNGPCWAPYVWFDIDEAELPKALEAAKFLAESLLERYRTLHADDLLRFFSGSKGFHIGVPVCWEAAPSIVFNSVARRMAEGLANRARVKIDSGVYDKVRCFRAPNSTHPKTGLRKRFLEHSELMGLSVDGILELAKEPVAVELGERPKPDSLMLEDWRIAVEEVDRNDRANEQRRLDLTDGNAKLNRSTLDFIRAGALEGDRHRLLFSAAANLAELGCPPTLAHELLTETALDSGLKPSEVRRQIDCGLTHVKGGKP